MSNENIFSKLEIPQTIAAGPGPGNTDERVLAAFANAGLADHMHADVLRGMIECKKCCVTFGAPVTSILLV